ncbi:polyprenol monophosphomannose synthase [Chlorobium sp. KB01]|uniref:polyprenol monophosphomannose synthase n=1 Tax=Chlorobium sp. KB01 TaxID=1917528 RepID=UPI00097553A0|nr:polyprenol monophosphomannose synthase [Chlorobium sp. KB01]
MQDTYSLQPEQSGSLHTDDAVTQNSVLVIIPTYNEAENIGRLLNDLERLYPSTVEMLVIDDNSPDGTRDIVRSLQTVIPRLHMITRERKLGLGTAYLTGFRYALEHNYRYVVEMDADYSHDPVMIRELLSAMTGADLVVGSRYMNNTVNVVNWPLGRLILSKLASIYTRMITGLPVADPTSGFKCFSAAVLRSLDLDRINSQGYSFQIEMNFRVWKKGFTIREVPIVFVDRTVGKSKMTKQNIREAIRIVWLLKIKSIFGLL